MNPERQETGETLPEWLRQLESLRTAPGDPHEFWPRYLECLATAAGGAAAVLMAPARSADDSLSWRSAWEWKSAIAAEALLGLFRGRCRGLAERSGRGRLSLVEPLDAADPGTFVITVPLLPLQGEPPGVVLILVSATSRSEAAALAERLRLAADVPGTGGLLRTLEQARDRLRRFGSTLDLLLQLNSETHFQSAAMLLCNEVAARHECTRVSLGWTEGGYIRLQAVSRLEKFEKKMAVSRALETAMEEAADQDSEIVWPAPIGGTLIVRDHETFARDQKSGHLCSVPVREGETAAGVLLCERESRPFTEDEVRHLRLFADQAARRLADLFLASRWFPVRWWASARRGLEKMFGVEHTLAKTVTVVCLALAVFLVFGRMEHRVRAPFSLRAAEVLVVPSPFDGYISAVLAMKGDEVTIGAALLRLDTTELLLERSEVLAEESVHLREVQQARSGGALADMQIALARLDQVRARLGVIDHRLERAEVRASLAGVVVEGDWREKVGGPVGQGEALYRIAQLDRMLVEVRLPEADVHRIRPGTEGRIAFASRPDRRIPVRVERIEPMAQVGPEGNHFLVRCLLLEEPEDWWRPGMAGSARLDAGRRSPGYILTHRTVDFLRLRFR